MAKTTGFMEFKRQDVGHRPVDERVRDHFEIDLPLSAEQLNRQTARCMDCGIPFCHGAGCPLENRIPEFNDLVYRDKWREAAENLHSTNNFPEFTGKLCPAPCETACTLGINDDPVLIKHIESRIAERAFAEGWVQPRRPARRSGRRAAVIGSGPAGLAAAQQLARAGHDVTVFEKDEHVGGLMRYGIPDFKLNKATIDRRLKQLAAEGVTFQTGVRVGEDVSARYLMKMFDAVCLTMGAGQPRDLVVPGRGFENILFAMDFLRRQNCINAGEPVDAAEDVSAKGRVVVVIGGGDTGSNCVGTARRQGAKEIHQFEILPTPPVERPSDTPWPTWPRVLRTSTSQEEGCLRRWCVLTKRFSGRGTRVEQLHAAEVRWTQDAAGEWIMAEAPGSEFAMNVDLVLLAMGFVHVEHGGLVDQFGLKLDDGGNITVANFMTSEEGVFAAGDAVLGASLVVRAIRSGRDAAAAVNRWLA